MNRQEYESKFEGKLIDGKRLKAEKALDLALDIRKFEIELYWKRATYFWALIAASLAGYALVYSNSSNTNSWLLLVFSCFGFLFTVAWYLVNRGSKFWQNNWERHVDLLEDMVIGPLYKTIAEDRGSSNLLTSSGKYSVSKINQILSFFVIVFWIFLIAKSLLPVSCALFPDYFKISVLTLTFVAALCLWVFGKSNNQETVVNLTSRNLTIDS